MIPKIIHYAWFGTKTPAFVEARVQEWREKLPDWEFKFWNDQNFDLSQYAFSEKMFQAGKLGYAADELRYAVLYQYGGFYLDTDMIVKKDLAPFLKQRMVWGFQYDNSILTSFIGAEAKEPLLAKILDVYAGRRFPELQNDMQNMTSNPVVTKILMKLYPEFRMNGKQQELASGILVYPRDYFTYASRNRSANYMEHLFDNSWGSANLGLRGRFKHIFKTFFPYLWADISARRGIKSAERDGIPDQR